MKPPLPLPVEADPWAQVPLHLTLRWDKVPVDWSAAPWTPDDVRGSPTSSPPRLEFHIIGIARLHNAERVINWAAAQLHEHLTTTLELERVYLPDDNLNTDHPAWSQEPWQVCGARGFPKLQTRPTSDTWFVPPPRTAARALGPHTIDQLAAFIPLLGAKCLAMPVRK